MNSLYVLNLFAKEMGQFIPFPVLFTLSNIRRDEIYHGWINDPRCAIGNVIDRINWEAENFKLQEYAQKENIEDIYWENGGTVSDNILIAFRSNISPAVNFVFEQLFVWKLISPLQLHHFGQNYGFFETMQESIKKDEERFGTKKIYPASMPSHCFVPNKSGESFSEHFYEAGRAKRYQMVFYNPQPENVEKFIMESPKAKDLAIGSGVNSDGSISINAPCFERNYKFNFIIEPVWRDPRRL
jgi:hypothetical protein